MIRETRDGKTGVVRERWDSTAGTYTSFDAAGQQPAMRPFTEQEAAAFAEQELQASASTTRSTLEDRARAALDANRAFLAAAKPGTAGAQASAAYDQTKLLTRECSALIRLLLNQLDGTD